MKMSPGGPLRAESGVFLCSGDAETWKNLCVAVSQMLGCVRSARQEREKLCFPTLTLLQQTNGLAQLPALAALLNARTRIHQTAVMRLSWSDAATD